MTVQVSTEVYGVRDALRVLGQLDRGARARAVNRVKAAGRPLTAAAAAPYPAGAPLSGWSTSGRLGYRGATVRAGVKLQVGGRTPRGASAFAVVTLVQGNAAAALFDIAGNAGGSKARPGPRNRTSGASRPFAELLNRYGKPAGRGMGKALPQVREVGYQTIKQALDELAADASRKLV